MKRTSTETIEHDDLIRMMVTHFTIKGLENIRADLPGMTSPDVIYGTKNNHVPDLTAYKSGVKVLLEAETSSTICDAHTSSQWSLFSDSAKKSGGEFHVAVPKGFRGDAERRAKALGIKVDMIWTPK